MERKKTGMFLSILYTVSLLSTVAVAQEKVAFGSVGKILASQVMPMLVAEEKGIWNKHGLKVEWFTFAAGAPMTAAMVAGSIEAAIDSAPGAILDISRRVPKLVVADMDSQYDFLVWVPSPSLLKDVRQLKGKRLGILRFGSMGEAYTKLLAKKVGLEGQVKVVATGGTLELMAALKTATVDAGLTSFYSAAPLKFKGELRELVNIREYLPEKWSELVVTAHKDFVARRKDAGRRLIAAFFESANSLLRDPASTLARMKSYLGYSDAMAKGIYETFRFSKDGKLDPQILKNAIEFLVQYELMAKEKAPPLESTYSLELAS